MFTGGMTAAYMTKLYVAIFWEKNADAATQARYDGMGRSMNGLSATALTLSAVLLPLFGFFPQIFMTRMAGLGEGFLHSAPLAHSVAYFSLENLLGAGKSLLIGGILYAGIRLLMMEQKDGARVYVDRWPAWLDLEESVYRPLVVTILPALGSLVSRMLDGVLDCKCTRVYLPSMITRVTRFFDRILDGQLIRSFVPGVATACSRLCDQLVDGLALAIKRTALRPLWRHRRPPVGTRWTWACGTVLNACVKGLNQTFRRKRPIQTDFVATLAAWHEEMSDTSRQVARSVSFGLLLLCIGLTITFFYMLTL